ncbi:MAG: hypothetical protein QOE70_6376 [Chthoniobacter sp.]|jgi:hypothetical protein|nr:hypothetical protein [Chthoniobacter sp.]
MNAIKIVLGLSTSQVTTGLGALRGQFKDFRKEVNSSLNLGQVFAFGAVVAGFNAILDKAGQLADLTARFGVGAEGLQRIGSAAEQDGVAMEGVAAALNKTIVAQGKAREGSSEMLKALDDLKISATDFVNLSPEEAFYAIADGVADSDDQVKAYNATLQLLGRGAGELIPLLQRGGAEIRGIGDAAGVMSADTVALLDDVGDKMSSLLNRFKVLGAETVGWLYKSAQTAGAALGAAWLNIKEMMGGESLGSAQAFKDQYEEIWNPKKDDADKKPKKRFDIAETEEQVKSATELAKLYDKIAEQKRQALFEQLEGESKINELIRQRDELYTNAATEGDAAKQAEMWIKAGDLEKSILQERDRVGKEEEQRQERIAKKRESLEDKALEQTLDSKPIDEKIAMLKEWQAKLREAAANTDDEETRLEIASKYLDNQSKLNGLEKEKDGKKDAGVSVQKGHLTNIGGGGGAFLARKDPDVAKTAKAAEKTAKATEAALKKLDRLADKIDARWK